LRNVIEQSFYEAGGGFEKSPLLSALRLPLDWTGRVEGVLEAVRNNLEVLELAADRTPETLKHILNAKYYKTANQLSAELREYERKMQAESAVGV